MTEFTVRNSMTARLVLGKLKRALGAQDNLWTDLDDELTDASEYPSTGFFCCGVSNDGICFKYWKNRTEFRNKIVTQDPPTEFTDVRDIKRVLRGKL